MGVDAGAISNLEVHGCIFPLFETKDFHSLLGIFFLFVCFLDLGHVRFVEI